MPPAVSAGTSDTSLTPTRARLPGLQATSSGHWHAGRVALRRQASHGAGRTRRSWRRGVLGDGSVGRASGWIRSADARRLGRAEEGSCALYTRAGFGVDACASRPHATEGGGMMSLRDALSYLNGELTESCPTRRSAKTARRFRAGAARAFWRRCISCSTGT